MLQERRYLTIVFHEKYYLWCQFLLAKNLGFRDRVGGSLTTEHGSPLPPSHKLNKSYNCRVLCPSTAMENKFSVEQVLSFELECQAFISKEYASSNTFGPEIEKSCFDILYLSITLVIVARKHCSLVNNLIRVCVFIGKESSAFLQDRS